MIALWNWAKRVGVETAYKVQVGDFINWNYGGTKSHIERVVKVHKGGWVTTAAFNVSVTGSGGTTRDGGGFAFKKRDLFHPLGQAMMRGAIGRRAS